MDQIKIGKFIAQMRKEKKLTQRNLADELCISDKTISKWECGKGLPEVSLMLPLCEILEISVNELLTGERLDASEYKEKAEENIMKLINEKQENKKRITLSIIVIAITILAAVSLVMISGLTLIPDVARISLVVIAVVIMVAGIGVAAVLDMDAGVYECPHCGERFVPSFKSYLMGAHTITRRSLKCPHCGKKSFCRRRLSQNSEN